MCAKCRKERGDVGGSAEEAHFSKSYEVTAPDNTLSDLINIAQIQKLSESHYKAAGMPIGIIDAKSGEVLVAAGWQDICLKFHRAHPETARRCRESDQYIGNRIPAGKPCAYKCPNGLWDIGIPILVEGRHSATLFLGQFFFEDESFDREFFADQARRFGFDLCAYMEALDRVPAFSREKVENILNYNIALANFIADIAAKKKSLKREFEERRRTEDALHERDRKFRAIFDQTFQFIGLLSTEGRLLEANRTALRFSGARESDVIGKPFWETPWWKHSAPMQEKLRLAVKSAATGACIRFETIHPSSDGSLCNVDFSLKPMEDEAGNVILLIAEGRDITERKRAEEAALKANRVINALWECNHALIHVGDELELLQEICRIIVEVGGYRMAWVGYAEKDADKRVIPVARYGCESGYLEKVDVSWADTERGKGPVGSSIRTGTQSVVRHVDLEPNFAPWREEALSRGYASVIALPLFVEGSIFGSLAIYAAEPDAFDADEVNLLSRLQMNLSFGITAIRTSQARKQAETDLKNAHDELEIRVGERTTELAAVNEQLRLEILERKRTEDVLRNSEAQLRFLSSRLLTAQEEASKKLAGELHDSIGSSLTAIKFSLESTACQADNGGIHRPGRLQSLIDLTQQAIDESRRIMTSLRPLILDDLGIIPTIEWYCRQFESIYSTIRIEKRIDIEEEDVPEPLKIVIFRIMQEALNNIAKYSNAESGFLLLRKRNHSIELTIEDNGVGFDPDPGRSGRGFKGGLGLAGMRERTELSGGSFLVSSQPGRGTTIHASWPSSTDK